MSKTNDTSRPTTLEDHRPLADSELDAVSGGQNCIEFTYAGFKYAICPPPPPPPPPPVK
jgi:hypothetical protein